MQEKIRYTITHKMRSANNKKQHFTVQSVVSWTSLIDDLVEAALLQLYSIKVIFTNFVVCFSHKMFIYYGYISYHFSNHCCK